MTKKSAGLLGMARRAGKVTAGFDAVVRLLKEGKAYPVSYTHLDVYKRQLSNSS